MSFISGLNSNSNIEQFSNILGSEDEIENENEDLYTNNIEPKAPYSPKYDPNPNKNITANIEKRKMELNNPLYRIKQKHYNYPTITPSPSPTIKPTPSTNINNKINNIAKNPGITQYSNITRVPYTTSAPNLNQNIIKITKTQKENSIKENSIKENSIKENSIKTNNKMRTIPSPSPVESEIIESFNGSIIHEMKNERLILKCILYGLLFYILANPRTFRYTSKIQILKNLDSLVLHTILFIIIVYIINLAI